MKVIILHSVLGRSKGGIEAWIYHACEELLLQGHEVAVVNTKGDTIPDDAVPFGVRIIAMDPNKFKPSVFFLRSVVNTKKILKSKLDEFDVVWTRSFGMAWAASKIVKNKKVIYINAAPYSYYAYRPFNILLQNNKGLKGLFKAVSSMLSFKVAHYFEINAIRNCTNVFLSSERKDQTISHFGLKDDESKFLVVPPGVNYKRFTPKYNDFQQGDEFKIISLSRLEKDKNIQCVIRAIGILKEQNYKTHLTVVGEGAYKSTLLNLADELDVKDKVSFVGRQEDVQNWYNKNHVFVLPSLYEGFGSVYVEAMASGLPAIAISNKSGKYSVAADEIIDHNLNGYLMKDDDPFELADLIKKIIISPDNLSRFSRNAREKAVNHFSWENTIKNLLEINYF